MSAVTQTALRGSAGFTAEAQAIFAAFPTPATNARKIVINGAVVALLNTGVWTKLDALYVFAAEASDDSLINWRTPGTFNCTQVNTPDFVVDRGWTGNGSDESLNTNLNPFSDTVVYARNDAHLSVWVLAGARQQGVAIGQGLGDSEIWPQYDSPFGTFTRINHAGGDVAVASPLGHTLGSRTGSSTLVVYKNGASAGTPSGSSDPVQDGDFYILSNGGVQQFSTFQVAAVSIGSGLSATDASNLYSILSQYLTTVGAI